MTRRHDFFMKFDVQVDSIRACVSAKKTKRPKKNRSMASRRGSLIAFSRKRMRARRHVSIAAYIDELNGMKHRALRQASSAEINCSSDKPSRGTRVPIKPSKMPLQTAFRGSILEIDSLTARELVAAARAEAERALTDVREEAKRIATLRERVDNNLWDILVRLHLVDAMIDVILRERFYHLDTLADMLYSDQIRYGLSPQHVRAIQAEVAASQAPKSRHPSPRGATGLDWRPHEDL